MSVPGCIASLDASSIYDSAYYGYTIATVFFGVTLVQAWIYFNKNEDKLSLRSFVAVLVLLDLSVTCLNAQIVHHYLVSNFGNLGVIQKIPITFDVEYELTILVAFMVDLFFASRLYYLSPKKRLWIPAVVTVLALTSTVTGTISFKDVLRRDLDDLSLPQIVIEISLFHSLSALSSLIVTGGLSWNLRSRGTGVKNSATVLQKLFAFVVTRGLLVSCVQVTMLVLYVVRPTDLNYWMPLHMILSKVYVITMIAMLNSRSSLRATLASDLVYTDSMFITSHTGSRPSPHGIQLTQFTVDPETGRKYLARNDGFVAPDAGGDVDVGSHDGVRHTRVLVSREKFSSV